MKPKEYIGAKRYVVYIGRKIAEKTLEFLSLPAQFVSNKVQELKNYTMWGNSKQRLLPDGYTQLEYIESTGTQYVVTDFFFNDIATDTLSCDFMRTGTGLGSLLYGFRDEYKVNGYGFQFNDVGRTYRQYGDSDSGLSSASAKNLNTRYTVQQTGYAYTIGGSRYTVVAIAPVQNYPLTVFAIRNADQPAATITPMRLYNLNVVTAGGNMILNLIPAKRNSDNELGLYDLVTGKFYINEGTGSFVAGEEFIPTPTPTNPIEIESVGDRTNNLFDKNTPIRFGQYSNGVWNDTNTRITSDYIECLSQNSYTMSIDADGTDNLAFINYNLFDKDKNWIGNRETNGEPTFAGERIHSFKINISNVRYIQITARAYSSATVDISSKNLNTMQFEEGSGLTPYEPYGYKIPVVASGKNLFDIDSPGVQWTTNIDASGNVVSSDVNSASSFIKVKPNTTYTVSFTGTRTNSITRYHLYDNQKQWIEQIATNSSKIGVKSVVTFTTTSNTNYIRFTFRGVSKTDSFLQADTQLEEGSRATPYEPSSSHINIYLNEPLRKIGDYADYIDFEGQKVVRNVEVVDDTGTLPIEQSLRGLDTPTEESITLPAITLQQGTLTIDTDTKIKPSKTTITGDIDYVR